MHYIWLAHWQAGALAEAPHRAANQPELTRARLCELCLSHVRATLASIHFSASDSSILGQFSGRGSQQFARPLIRFAAFASVEWLRYLHLRHLPSHSDKLINVPYFTLLASNLLQGKVSILCSIRLARVVLSCLFVMPPVGVEALSRHPLVFDVSMESQMFAVCRSVIDPYALLRTLQPFVHCLLSQWDDLCANSCA